MDNFPEFVKFLIKTYLPAATIAIFLVIIVTYFTTKLVRQNPPVELQIERCRASSQIVDLDAKSFFSDKDLSKSFNAEQLGEMYKIAREEKVNHQYESCIYEIKG